MSRRHADWYTLYFQTTLSTPADYLSTETFSLKAIRSAKGIKQRIVPYYQQMQEVSTQLKYTVLGCCEPFDLGFFMKAAFPVFSDFRLISNFHLLRILMTRTLRIGRILLGYPVRGQRRWSNAMSARKSIPFFKQSIRAYEIDFWNYGGIKTMKAWTKMDEFRFKAQHKVVQKKKRVSKKFKKRSELRLAQKRHNKKTPWS